MIYNVTCNTDEKYLQHCMAMLCSLFENNKGIQICVHVLTKNLQEPSIFQLQNLSDKYKQQCRIYDVDDSLLDGVVFRANRPLTKAAYYRILLPSILDDSILKVLYLDCDVIVLGSIAELFAYDLQGYALAACQDIMPFSDEHRRQLSLDVDSRTFCSGVMLINLEYWRQNDAQTKLLEFSKIQRTPVYLHDQDSLNYLFKDCWLKLPNKWNKTAMSICPLDPKLQHYDRYEYMYAPKILHYASEFKPWYDIGFADKSPYVKYLNLSGYDKIEYTHTASNMRLQLYFKSVRYYINRYIRPIVPDIVEVIICDVINIFKFVYAIINPRYMKTFILKRWLHKYGQ